MAYLSTCTRRMVRRTPARLAGMAGMTTTLIDLLTQAHRAGLILTHRTDGQLVIHGPRSHEPGSWLPKVPGGPAGHRAGPGPGGRAGRPGRRRPGPGRPARAGPGQPAAGAPNSSSAENSARASAG